MPFALCARYYHQRAVLTLARPAAFAYDDRTDGVPIRSIIPLRPLFDLNVSGVSEKLGRITSPKSTNLVLERLAAPRLLEVLVFLGLVLLRSPGDAFFDDGLETPDQSL